MPILVGSARGVRSEDSPVFPDTHRAHADVKVRERDPEEAGPRPIHVTRVEAAHAIVSLLANRRVRKLIEQSAHKMTERMTPKRVAAQQDNVGEQNQSAQSDPETAVKPARAPDVVRQDHEEDERQVQKIAVNILKNQRK